MIKNRQRRLRAIVREMNAASEMVAGLRAEAFVDDKTLYTKLADLYRLQEAVAGLALSIEWEDKSSQSQI